MRSQIPQFRPRRRLPGGGHSFARAMLPLAPVQFPHTIPNVVPRGTYVFPVVDASADLARDERALETRVRE